MTGVLSQLGSVMATQVMPALANAGVVEKMTVSRTAKTRGAMGGSAADGTVSTPYTGVPVSVELDKKGGRIDAQGKLIALQTYILEFPVMKDGSYIAIDLSTDKFIVDARTPIPARTYKIQCPADDCKVMNRYICTEEI